MSENHGPGEFDTGGGSTPRTPAGPGHQGFSTVFAEEFLPPDLLDA